MLSNRIKAKQNYNLSYKTDKIWCMTIYFGERINIKYMITTGSVFNIRCIDFKMIYYSKYLYSKDLQG